jgi:hypothetical protein
VALLQGQHELGHDPQDKLLLQIAPGRRGATNAQSSDAYNEGENFLADACIGNETSSKNKQSQDIHYIIDKKCSSVMFIKEYLSVLLFYFLKK